MYYLVIALADVCKHMHFASKVVRNIFPKTAFSPEERVLNQHFTLNETRILNSEESGTRTPNSYLF